MILDSFVPDQWLLPSQEPERKVATLCRGEKFFEGYFDQDGFYISRVISTDPADYLDPSCFPGQRFPYGTR